MKLFLIGILLSFMFVNVSIQQPETIYTDLVLEKCKPVKLPKDAPYSKVICEGVGGYKLAVIDEDSRQAINVIDPKGKEHPLELIEKVSNAFSEVGKKAEWRVVKQANTIKPTALIVRYNAYEDSDNPSKITSYLTVTKITPNEICLVGKIKPIKNQNEEARELADNSSAKSCLQARD
jgi:hypothetical protein